VQEQGQGLSKSGRQLVDDAPGAHSSAHKRISHPEACRAAVPCATAALALAPPHATML
jgi:hypothetical protein